ncbi:MAG: hypothetical protein VX768_18920 [Planctomycetota bacterium]|nr:hypothetical protein [Planctomycetota bacterium]
MDFYDFFFPEQAQAAHLRKIANQNSIQLRKLNRHRPDSGQQSSSAEVQELQEDVRFLTMVIAALLRRFTETETASLADIRDLLDEIDGLDGAADGGLDPGVLRGLLGILKASGAEAPEPDDEEIRIVTTPRYRSR